MSRRKTTRKSAGPAWRMPKPSWPAIRRTLVVLLWAVAIGGAGYGLHRLEPLAAAATTAEPARLEWVNLPPWLADPQQIEVLRHLERVVNLPPDADIMAPQLCEYVGRGLEASPYVARVSRVAKLTDGRVQIWADFRKPFAWVAWRGMAHLVDREGVRLPVKRESAYAYDTPLFVIDGADTPPPGDAGQQWVSPRVAAGLKLAELLYAAHGDGRLPMRAYLRAIDAGAMDRLGGNLRLVTIYPESYIVWGLPPGAEYGVEASPEQKLRWLRHAYNLYGGQMPNEGPIDLRDPSVLVVGRQRVKPDRSPE